MSLKVLETRLVAVVRGVVSSGVCSVVCAVLCTAALAACSSADNGKGSDSVTTPAVSTPAASTPTVSTPAVSTPAAPVTSSSAPATSSSPAVVVKPAPATPLREVTVTSTDGARTYDIKIWFEVMSDDCASHAYGVPVVQYLTAHPCRGLDRILATTTVDGKAVGFAQSTLGFVGNAPDVYSTAGNFASLERKDNTGSIDDLISEGYRLPDGPSKLPSPDAFNVQSQDSGVVIVDAFYLNGKTKNNDPALVQMAQDIYLQF